MKQILTVTFLLISFLGFSQKKFFHLYSDSATLVKDANKIVADFSAAVNKIHPVFTPSPTPILNTQVYLISYSPKTNEVNLPIWSQVIPEQKQFFYELAGGEEQGRRMFGLFFNGFYMAHEMGHALQTAAKKRDSSLYQNEYFANIVGMLYWRKVNRAKELEDCYRLAKRVTSQLPNPVPEGGDPIKYFNEHYSELGADPYKYGYYQMAQFVEIYEDKNLKGFDEFIADFLKK